MPGFFSPERSIFCKSFSIIFYGKIEKLFVVAERNPDILSFRMFGYVGKSLPDDRSDNSKDAKGNRTHVYGNLPMDGKTGQRKGTDNPLQIAFQAEGRNGLTCQF